MGEITPKTGPSDGTTRGGGDRQQAAEPAQVGAFRGKTVREVVAIGKSSDAEGAVRHLSQLSKDGNKEALRVLRGAARTARLNPQCTFSTLAQSAMSVLNSASQKQGPEKGSVHQNAPVLRTESERYNALILLLKSEFRGETNPVRKEMNLLTGKPKVGEEPSLTFLKFNESLEKNGVAQIAINWFEELDKSDYAADKRIKIQTRLVNVLTNLKNASIYALEVIRASQTSSNSQVFLDFLSDTISIDDQFVKHLKELNTLFPDEPFEKLWYWAGKFDAAGMTRLKELKQLFPDQAGEEVLCAADELDAAGMTRFKELKQLFPDGTLGELLHARIGLRSIGMTQLKELKQMFPEVTLGTLDSTKYRVYKEGMTRLKELKQLFPDGTLGELIAGHQGLPLYAASMTMLKELKQMFPNASVRELRHATYGLITKSMTQLKELKQMFPNASVRELRHATYGLSTKGMTQLKELKQLSPDASVRELRLRVTARVTAESW